MMPALISRRSVHAICDEIGALALFAFAVCVFGAIAPLFAEVA